MIATPRPPLPFLLVALAAALALSATAGALAAPGGDAPPPPKPVAAAEAPVPVPEPSETALRYYRSGNVLWLAGVAWELLVPGAILWFGISGRMRDLAQRIGRRWPLVVAVYFVAYSVLTFVIGLPLAWYRDYARPHAYELSNLSLGKWLGDSLKGLAVGLVLGCLFLWVPYLLLRRSPARWWLWTGLAIVPFLSLMIMIAPIWIAPLFNDFGPMQDQDLEAEILALAERSGIEGSRVFEVDMSTDTKTVNAYVTGFLDTKRIVLWDTIIEKLDRDELLFVMGHEMGHYVLGHVVSTLLAVSALAMLGLWLIHRVSGAILRRNGARFGFDALSDIASLPLLILLLNLYALIVAPGFLAYSRHHEHEADRFGLELTRDNRAAALAFAALQEENLGNPRPGLLYKLWRASHPPLGERIDFCNTYRPWRTGEPQAYEHLLRDPP